MRCGFNFYMAIVLLLLL